MVCLCCAVCSVVCQCQLFCSCCLPSETYGRNGVIPIFRSFHRTASSTTCRWSRWNVLMCLLYICALRSHVWVLRMPYYFYKVSSFSFCVCTFPFFRKYTVHVCYVPNVILRILLMTDGLNAVGSNDVL